MTANTLRSHGKRGFLLLLLLATGAFAAEADGPGWRLTVIGSFERPPLHESVPGSETALLAVGRPAGHGELEFAETRGAWRVAREMAEQHGKAWLEEAKVEIRRDAHRVIERIVLTADNPLLPAVTLTPAFYEKFEPLLGDRFHVIIPERGTIALYPKAGGHIPTEDVAALLEVHRMATYPVSREVFSATRGRLTADGILEEP